MIELGPQKLGPPYGQLQVEWEAGQEQGTFVVEMVCDALNKTSSCL